MIRTTLNSDEMLANVQIYFDDSRHADDVSYRPTLLRNTMGIGVHD
jgi:hypothetical protein